MRNARLLVAYDGRSFHGSAASPGVRTVMGVLTEVIVRVTRHPTELTAAGRTDAGVHAWGQVVSGHLPATTDLGRLQRSLNRLCAPDLAVREITWAPPDFDARFSATSRTYRYDAWNDPVPNPLMADRTWHVPVDLDLQRMSAASVELLGEHDFTSFCRRPKASPGDAPPSLVRLVQAASWQRIDDGPLLRFEIGASSFCHQMVRSIVGTLVDVGAGRLDRTIAEILAAGDRHAAGRVAPPTGLVLWHVGYDGRRWDA